MNKMTKIDEDKNSIYYLVEISIENQYFKFRIKVDKLTNIPYFNVEDLIKAAQTDRTLNQFLESEYGLQSIDKLISENPGMTYSNLFF